MHSFKLSVTMDVSDVKASTSSGTVHGVVVGELSPVKTSSKNRAVKYFASLSVFLPCPSSPLWPRKLSYYKASVNYSGNSSCDECTYQLYMERQ